MISLVGRPAGRPTRLFVSPDRPETESIMRTITQKLIRFLKTEDGPTAVEYAVMLALIIVICLAAITTLGENTNNTFSSVAAKVSPATGS
jgi:pilus assembly protein Flp/PilA